MGFFSFRVAFDETTSFPREESYNRLLNYLKKKRVTVIQQQFPERIVYRTKTSLLSWPREFSVTFKSVDENRCLLNVHVDCGQCDLGLSKPMFKIITKTIY